MLPRKKPEKNESILRKLQRYYYIVKSCFLTIFGDIKIFRWPFFLIYTPLGYLVKGEQTRELFEILQPGDVVMRAYNNYLDGYFIPIGESRCSHSGVYDGKNKIYHSVAEGLEHDDIIEFCRTDRIMVLRPAKDQEWALEHARKCKAADIPYDFDFKPDAGKYYCHEFTASCYPDLEIKPLSRKIFRIIPSPVVYLADSFYTNSNFKLVYSYDGNEKAGS